MVDNILVAVHSCIKFIQNGVHEAIRQTWGRKCPWDLKFFVGQPGELFLKDVSQEYIDSCKKEENLIFLNGDTFHGFRSFETFPNPLLKDEIQLDCLDAYMALPWKKRCISQYALDNKYEYILQLCADSFVREWKGIYYSEFDRYPYSGSCVVYDRILYTTGVYGYWLSRTASNRLIDSCVDQWSEDFWVGSTLHKYGIGPYHIHMTDWVDELSPVGRGKGLSPEIIYGHRK
jgi:hypothetical protein